jgi:hypothetical protein
MLFDRGKFSRTTDLHRFTAQTFGNFAGLVDIPHVPGDVKAPEHNRVPNISLHGDFLNCRTKE